jgi:hypothetical protein
MLVSSFNLSQPFNSLVQKNGSNHRSIVSVYGPWCAGRVPWSGLSVAEVRAEMRRGACLPLDRSSTPPHLYQLMRVGLLSNQQGGDQGMLDLQEIRDMLLFTRVSYIVRYHQVW